MGFLLQSHKEEIQISHIVKERVESLFDVVEVEYDVRLVLTFGKILYESRFPHASCTLNEEGGFSLSLVFPTEHFVVKFSSKYHIFVTI